VTGSNWYVDQYPAAVPGGTAVGGGGNSEVIMPRSSLDAARMANGFAPGASHPDGYLGTITDRRQDRLMGAIQNRLTDKSYQRGVHKGERLGRDDYYWTADVNPDAGIQRQSMVQLVNQEGGIVMMTPRSTPVGNPVENLTAMGNKATLTPDQEVQVAQQYGVDPGKSSLPMTMTDPGRAAQWMRYLPSYAR
jgi:hypothetical protein